MLPFSENLKKLRKERNMSRQELAKATGVSLSSLGYYETNSREPTASVLIALATVLNCSIDELLGFSATTLGQYVKIVNKIPNYKVRVDQKLDRVYVDRHFEEPDGSWNDCIEFTTEKFISVIGDAVNNYEDDPYQILRKSIENEIDYYQRAKDWLSVMQSEYEKELREQEEIERKIINDLSPDFSSPFYKYRVSDYDRKVYKEYMNKKHLKSDSDEKNNHEEDGRRNSS